MAGRASPILLDRAGLITMNQVEANPKGYNFSLHVTQGHESEALAAQRKKRPSRIGKVILKLLGFRGKVGPDYLGD